MSDDQASVTDLTRDEAVAEHLREISPGAFAAASGFWRVSIGAEPLTPRMRELLLLAMHATPTSLNVEATERQVRRARAAGATPHDIVDVLITLVGVANHALYFSVPVLEQELAATGMAEAAEVPGFEVAYEAAKADFLAARGFWNSDRDQLARLMPEYFAALNTVSTESWKNGPLSARERELVCIAIDCVVTHTYEPGLRLHIRNAIGHGSTREEILQVFQLAATVGLEGYVLAGRVLYDSGSS